ncbi:Aste57867_11803 [Aphanomyces stellatus]|uniref:Aste57867_11803 protein n=1 Tax=Aphanomyces stellatus TaxID=120398 RepID=A0A485KVW6_9STRA|nr:hypothetical protein As57867_011758 [Aphanomyces stellatus]VFT88658.1 Aste57867_11803 [Aphanomyces stellatus]
MPSSPSERQTVPVFLKPSIWSTRYGPNFFTLSVTGFIIQNNTFAEYSIEVKRGTEVWVVNHRFREFVDLWEHLYGLGPRLPSLPPKTFLCFRDLSPDYLLARQRALEECLHDLLQIPGAGEIESVTEFLELLH